MTDTAAVQVVLPAGYHARLARQEDAAGLAEAANAEAAHIGIETRITVDAIRRDWEEMEEAFPSQALTILADDGRIVAGVMLITDRTAEENGYFYSILHPDASGRGLEAVMVTWLETLMQQVAFPVVAPDVKIALLGFANERNEYRRTQYEALGFREVRRFYRMQIDLDTPPIVMPLPAGYRYVPYQHPDDLEQTLQVMNRAFEDHYGYIELPLEDDLRNTRRWFDNAPGFDPALFLHVVDEAGNLAACTWTFAILDSEPQFAIIADVGVLREHRGRGIARAMITESFARLYARERRQVILNVDTENPSGALKLYESVGMRPGRVNIRLEKVLRPGRSRATVS